MRKINACFISYRHTGDAAAHRFVLAFHKQLKRQLCWLIPNAEVYLDEQGLQIGDMYNAELALQLCRSACMVLFFSPLHFAIDHPYCALEYHAMLELERKRLGEGIASLHNKGLIFPVVFRGLDSLPEEIKGMRNYENFDHILVEKDFERRACQARIKALAEQIGDRYVRLHNAGVFAGDECDTFRFPAVEEIRPWLECVSPVTAYPMPGR